MVVQITSEAIFDYSWEQLQLGKKGNIPVDLMILTRIQVCRKIYQFIA